MFRRLRRRFIDSSDDLRTVHNQCIDGSVKSLQPSLQDLLGDRGFLLVRLVLWILPCWILLLDPGLLVPVVGLLVGSVALVLIEPDRLASEALRVVAASLWRFTALLAVVLWLG